MSQQMTVERVVRENEWSGKFGKNQAYALDLRLADGRVELGVTSNRKVKEDGTHNEPHENEVIWGDIVPDGRGGEKLQIDYDAVKEHGGGAPQQFSSSSESSTSNNSKSASSKGADWDAIGAEKRRCHSQEMALRAASVSTSTVTVLHGFKLDPAFTLLIDAFDQDAIAAGQKASQGAGAGAGGDHSPGSSSAPSTSAPPPGEAPLDLSGARTEEPAPQISTNFPKSELPDDSHQWIESLLVVAGANHGARELALYAVNKLRPDQLKTLEGELNDPEQDRKAHGLKRIEASYEKAEGHPVPTGVDDSDLPF